MTAQTKTVVKTYFETGDRPTQAQFVDLIDSYQDTDVVLSTLTSSATGIVTKSSAGGVVSRTIEGTTNEISVSAGNGIVGNPTIALAPIVDLTSKVLRVATASAADNSTNAASTAFVVASVSAGNARFKVGSFTRDVSLASGSQAVTGVGFQPKAIAVCGGSTGNSWFTFAGFTDGSTAGSVQDNGPVNGGSYSVTTDLLKFIQSGSDNYVGALSSFDADGFTISWTKTGSPTGTATVNYLAIR